MTSIFTILVLAALLLINSSFVDSLDSDNAVAQHRELQSNYTKTYVMTIDAMEPLSADLLTPCVTDQMIAVLQAWAESLNPTSTVVPANSTVVVTAPLGTVRELMSSRAYIHIMTSLHCYICRNCRRVRRRKLQTTASVSMVKVLLPLVCPEIQNITTVNMTLSSV